MRYLDLRKTDTENGPGFRVTLFVSGCEFKCVGCWNPRSWNPRNGELYTEQTETEILDALAEPYVSGLSVLGGEPFLDGNWQVLETLLRKVTKSVWLWTGYTLEELQLDNERTRVLPYIHTLIDGQFEIDNRDLTLPYCGSTNQRVIQLEHTN